MPEDLIYSIATLLSRSSSRGSRACVPKVFTGRLLAVTALNNVTRMEMCAAQVVDLYVVRSVCLWL